MYYFSKHYLQIEKKFTCIRCNLHNTYNFAFSILTLVKHLIAEEFILFQI